MSDLREAAVTFLAIVVALVVIVLALFAVGACTFRVAVEVHSAPVARDAGVVAVTPPQSPGLIGDAGPCGVSITSLNAQGRVTDGCGAAVYIPLSATTRMATCENAGDVFEECQRDGGVTP